MSTETHVSIKYNVYRNISYLNLFFFSGFFSGTIDNMYKESDNIVCVHCPEFVSIGHGK